MFSVEYLDHETAVGSAFGLTGYKLVIPPPSIIFAKRNPSL